MFWNKKEKITVYAREEMTEMYTHLIKELEDVYLPIRDKCEEIIRSHGLNHYPLKDVLELRAYDEPEYEIVIYDVKEDWWDGEKYLKKTDTLLDEKFRLEFAYEFYNKGDVCTPYSFDFVCYFLSRLDDPTDICKRELSLLQKRNELNK